MHNAVTAVPSTISVPYWMQWIVYFGGLLFALGVIWQKFIRPLDALVAELRRFVSALPSLLAIEAEFRPNGGNSMRDRIEHIATQAEEQAKEAQARMDHIALQAEEAKDKAAATAAQQIELAESFQAATQQLAKTIEDRAAAMAERVEQRAAEIAEQHRQALEAFRSHNLNLNQVEIAMLADQAAHLDVTPLAPSSSRVIVPREDDATP